MVVEGSGALNEAGYWVKGAGGHQQGYQLLERLQAAGATTLPAILKYSATHHATEQCMGTRELLARERIVEKDKNLEKLKLGEYTYLTYGEVLAKVRCITAGLGVIGTGDTGRVAMFAETRAEWFMTAIGCLWQGLAVVTVYTNLADDNIVSSLNETEVSVVVTTHDLLQRTLKLLPQCPKVEKLIVIEDQLEGVGTVPEDLKGVTVIPFSDVVKAGEGKDEPKDMPSGSDLAIIMYTSGSSGRPKGVELTHDNLFWAISGYTIQADLQLGDRYIAYLPLAHVMELATEIALVALNVSIIYASPHTLTDHSPKVMKGTQGDARAGHPTCMNAVPLILERIIKGVSKSVEDGGFFKSMIFSGALKLKQLNKSENFVSKALDSIVFNRVKEQLGGHLRMLVVGGAPLSADTHNKIRALFGCTLQMGYGATETAASITSSDTDDPRPDHCGPPNRGVLLRLRDWKEGGYLTTDTPHPRGEILVGGPTVSRGYFKLPEETAEAFIEEDGVRWFQTGDIGMMDNTGVLRIVDRMKDLIKLHHGEYISLGTIESKLKTHPLIESICVYAYSGAVRCVAIIVPVIPQLRKVATNLGMQQNSNLEFCQDEGAMYAVQCDLRDHAKKQGLSRWETPFRVHMTLEPWTPESGLVTGSLKNRRVPIYKRFKEQIETMYTKKPQK